MWRIWLLFDPRRALIAILIFAFTMVMIMHFIMLSTERFNFLGSPAGGDTASITETVDGSMLG